MKKTLSLIITTLFVMFTLCSCNSAPKTTIRKLEKALNRCDINSAVECFEPDVQAIYNGILAVGDFLTDSKIDFKKAITGLGWFVNIYGNELIDGGLPEVKIKVNSVKKISKDKVLADMTVKYKYKGKNKKYSTEKDVCAYLVRIRGEWYFSTEKVTKKTKNSLSLTGEFYFCFLKIMALSNDVSTRR